MIMHFLVVVGIGSIPTSLLANTVTAFNHREKKYEERESESVRREIAIQTVTVDPRITIAKTA